MTDFVLKAFEKLTEIVRGEKLVEELGAAFSASFEVVEILEDLKKKSVEGEKDRYRHYIKKMELLAGAGMSEASIVDEKVKADRDSLVKLIAAAEESDVQFLEDTMSGEEGFEGLMEEFSQARKKAGEM